MATIETRKAKDGKPRYRVKVRIRGEKPRTLDELGRMFNVTRERIRQVESQSLQKLGSLPDSGRLG